MLEEYVIIFAIYLLYHKFLKKVGLIATPQISPPVRTKFFNN